MKNIPVNSLLLVDGSSYLFRAFHALPPLATTTGQQTGAIYGVITMLRKLIVDYSPKYMAVVFDAKEKNFRHKLYANYKANRAVMPEELVAQLQPLQQVISAMGIQVIVVSGVEADDVIGTLATKAQAHGLFTIISTGDKDLAQLVNEQVILINTMTDTVLDIAGVIAKFGVKPQQMVAYLSLIGDSVDNIPGVAKVGPKTAVKWLQLYGDLPGVIANAQNITGKIGEQLRTALGDLPLYQELVTIKTDVALDYLPEQLLLQAQDLKQLQIMFQKLEFKKWLQDLTPTTTADNIEVIANNDYHSILTYAAWQDLWQQLQQSPIFALNIITTNFEPLTAEIVGFAFKFAKLPAVYLPITHDCLAEPFPVTKTQVLAQLKPILENSAIAKVGHNMKFILHVLANYGINLQGELHDVMLSSYIVNSTGNKHDLLALANKYLARKPEFADNSSYDKPANFQTMPIPQLTAYAAETVDIIWQLHPVLQQQLQAIPQLMQLYKSLELALLPVLLAMERQGVLIEPQLLQQQSIELAARLLVLATTAYELAGQEFNLNSPKQLQEILFTKLALPVMYKTPTGQPSTAEAALQDLAITFPLPKLILEYRSLSKLKSTYTDSLPLQINPSTGRIHTSYQQAITSTGRLTSVNPNLQNIPIRTEEGRKIRSAFIAPPGYQLLSADYSQIELRLMAHLAAEPVLLTAFANNIDIHKVTAAEVFNIAVEQVTPEQRRRAKAINFGLMYGMSAFGLAKQLDITPQDAEQYVAFYFTKFPQVKMFLQQTKEFAATYGYVETLFGRRLYLPDIKAKHMAKRKAAERAAINAPMQGGQADIIKKAMIDIHAWQLANKLDFHMLLQVHDELIFEVPIANLAIVRDNVIQLMTNVVKLTVDLVVNVGVGDNWEQAH